MKRKAAAVIASVVVAAATVVALAGEEAPIFKNVKVLTDVKTKSDMRRLMKEQSAALGVKCSFCHVAGKFDADDKATKVTARRHLEMAREINAKYLAGTGHEVSCWTCHRGAAEPESAMPAAAMAADTFEAEESEQE